jgi:hypothetical protein
MEDQINPVALSAVNLIDKQYSMGDVLWSWQQRGKKKIQLRNYHQEEDE